MIKHAVVEPVISKPCGTRSCGDFLKTLIEHTFGTKYSNQGIRLELVIRGFG